MIIKAYSGFFLLPSRLAGLLLIAATFVEPRTGFAGLVAGLTVLLSQKLLDLKPREDHLDLVNGVLLGLLLGATYAATPRLLLMLLACGPMAVLGTQVCSVYLGRVPILCAPFAAGGLLCLSAGAALYLPLASVKPAAALAGPPLLHLYLQALGGIYLSPYSWSGILVLLALALSCRYLTGLTLVGFAASELVMYGLGVVDPLTRSIGATGGILCALILGGLMVAPRLSSVFLAFAAAVGAAGLYLALVGPMARLGFPPLAWPFMLITWTALTALPHHQHLEWQSSPALPTEAAERQTLARSRGVTSRSIAIRAPFEGTWDVYQSFDGPHTHKGPWRFALDFIICRDGTSFTNEGKQLSDYYCFGQPVFSPVNGTVVATKQDIPDNLPGEVNIQQRFGNHVLVALGQDRYLLLAHLKQNSLRVKIGDSLEVGMTVGECGNSGRSPQPHLHVHIQRGVELGSATLPFHLSAVKVNGDFFLNSVPNAQTKVSSPEFSSKLREVLEMQVGRRLIFLVEKNGLSELQTLEVTLDLGGRFWLKARNGAKVALYQDDKVITCYDRNRIPDALLDLFILALGVTPLCEEPGEWLDTPPSRLLPDPFWSLRQCGHTRYERFKTAQRGWIQTGAHSAYQGGKVKLQTRARFTHQRGLRELSLLQQDKTILEARVVGVGMNADRGTPGWEMGIIETGNLPTAQ